MTRATIIGGSGHIGSFLVPRLVEAGFDVTNVTRAQRRPYVEHAAWRSVRTLEADRTAGEADGSFARSVAATKPDVLVDLICFTPASARHLVEGVAHDIELLVHIGTIWVHGPSAVVPTTEAAPRRPFGTYGVDKAAIERFLLGEAGRRRLPVTIVHPGHIVGPGWVPLNPAGNFNPAVFDTIARGNTLVLPNLGLETVHHVHADDVAQIVMKALAHRSVAVGEAFHAVSPAALTLRGYAEAMYRWSGHEPALDFRTWPDWSASQSAEDAAATFEHIARSPNCSIDKARRLLGVEPRYSSLEAVQEAVAALRQRLAAG